MNVFTNFLDIMGERFKGHNSWLLKENTKRRDIACRTNTPPNLGCEICKILFCFFFKLITIFTN